MSDHELAKARANLDEAITWYARAAGKGNELATAWLLVVDTVASDLDAGDTAILVTTPTNQRYITNLGLAVHASRYFGPGDDE